MGPDRYATGDIALPGEDGRLVFLGRTDAVVSISGQLVSLTEVHDVLADHPFVPVKLELQGKGIFRELALPFLDRAAIERYLAATFPEHRLPAEFVALIHAKTEGSPLFLVDLLYLGLLFEESYRRRKRRSRRL